MTEQSGIEVNAAEPEYGDDPLVAIDVALHTAYRCLPDLFGERQRGLLAALVLFPVVLAELPAHRGVNPVQTNTLAADLDRIAIDDRCRSDYFSCRGRGCGK